MTAASMQESLSILLRALKLPAFARHYADVAQKAVSFRQACER